MYGQMSVHVTAGEIVPGECILVIHAVLCLVWNMLQLGPDHMSRAGPFSWAVSVCRDDSQPGIT